MRKRYDFDPMHTRLGFSAKHLMVTTVRGHFAKFVGYVEVEDDDPLTATGEVTVETASVDTANEMRDNDLRSDHFFDAEHYPELRFVITGVEAPGGERYRVRGDLTIRDVTKPVELEAEIEGRLNDPWGNERVAVSASGQLNRTNWNMTWNQVLEAGRVVVSEQVKLELEAALVRPLEVPAATS
jgi:polyisoprenoid-binding protein YceI